ncbi:MAG: ABC transporter permease [Eubacteriales bacterium]
MKTFSALTKRNIKMFFKDKGMFFTSLITPVILLVLYSTFLANIYHDSFASTIPDGFEVPERLIDATVGGELISSLLAVSCVTVAFCSNLLMVQDKISGARKDMLITPVKKSTLAISYYVASLLTTLIISYTAMAAGFIYLAIKGWYLSFSDVMLIIIDVFLLTMFGVALSSVVNVFLSTQGQASAVGTIVSAGYGFICGAYMPISSFGKVLRNVLSFLPGTYATSIIRNHSLDGVYDEMSKIGMPGEVIEKIKDGIDCNLYFFGDKVDMGIMYIILVSSIVLLIGAFILINALCNKKA